MAHLDQPLVNKLLAGKVFVGQKLRVWKNGTFSFRQLTDFVEMGIPVVIHFKIRFLPIR